MPLDPAPLERARAALRPLDAPFIEPATLLRLDHLLALVGERLADRLLLVAGVDGPELCLRPDMTLPVALHYAETALGEVRAYRYSGRVYRAPRPNGPQETESTTLGVERFGEADAPTVDAEVLASALDACAAAGLREVSVKLTDLGLLGRVLDACGLDEAWSRRLRPLAARPSALAAALAEGPATLAVDDPARALLDLPPAEARRAALTLVAAAGAPLRRPVEEVADRLVAKAALARSPAPPEAVRAVVAALLRIKGSPRKVLDARRRAFGEAGLDLDASLEDSARRLDRIDALAPGVELYVDPTFEGNFWYYDGFMFSVRAKARGQGGEGGRVLASGGRYDSLVGRLTGGPSAPAAGVSLFSRAIEEQAA